MSNRKEKVLKILYPKTWLVFFMFNGAAAALFYALTETDIFPLVQYTVYAFSTYVLVVVVLQIIKRAHQILAWSDENRFIRRWKEDSRLRFLCSLYMSFGINTAFAVLKVYLGYRYNSYWLLSIGVYYFILSGLRFMLLLRDRLSTRQELAELKRLHQLKSYRFCGWLMLLLNIAMSGMVVQMIWKGECYRYPGFLVFAFAAYAFYALIMAIINFVKYWHIENPILSAAKRLSLATACMSVYALQSAMIVQFGEGDERFQFIMNSLTGFAVCLFIFLLAIHMIISADKEIKLQHTYIEKEE